MATPSQILKSLNKFIPPPVEPRRSRGHAITFDAKDDSMSLIVRYGDLLYVILASSEDYAAWEAATQEEFEKIIQPHVDNIVNVLAPPREEELAKQMTISTKMWEEMEKWELKATDSLVQSVDEAVKTP